MTGAELAHRRDRLWLIVIRVTRLRELARRERATARWHLRRARRLVERRVSAKPLAGERSVLRLRTPGPVSVSRRDR